MSKDESAIHVERAKRAYRAAKTLQASALIEDAYSRGYYALVHLAYALFIQIGENLPKTHSGLIAKMWVLMM